MVTEALSTRTHRTGSQLPGIPSESAFGMIGLIEGGLPKEAGTMWFHGVFYIKDHLNFGSLSIPPQERMLF